MQIYWCKTTPINVGDVLNVWLWPKLIPGIAGSNDPGVLFGIGSVLDARMNTPGTKYVLGSGARRPNHGIHPGSDVRFYAVRGPLSARALGLPVKLAMIDPGVLLNRFCSTTMTQCADIGLIPYFASPHHEWQSIADRLGLTLISPHLGVDTFVERVIRCRFIITEAMHGAIIADCLRIPWYPIRANSRAIEGDTSTFKWTDWCQSINIEFQPLDLPPLWPTHGILPTSRTKLKASWIESRLRSIIRGRTRYMSNTRVLNARITQLDGAIDSFSRSVIRRP